jgi:P27 family predicted phage terminase small subunit
MGKRGPIPKSNEQEILEGNPSKRPLKKELPKPGPGIPTCPTWLSVAAKREWKRLTPELARMGLLSKLDRNMLAGYCSAYALWQQAQEVLNQQGTVYVSPKGKLETRPEVEIARTTGEMMQGFANELGLTPTSRARMNLPKENEEIDPLEEFLREGERNRRR